MVVCYRYPSSPVDLFNKAEKVLSHLDKDGKKIILMGDTNCDLLNEKTCSSAANYSRYIRDLYELLRLNQLICKPTRVTLTTSTLIDHISTTCIDNIFESGMHKVSLSDHYRVFCKRKVNAVLGVGHKLVITRNMKHFDKNAFLGDSSSNKWDQVVNKTDNVDVPF